MKPLLFLLLLVCGCAVMFPVAHRSEFTSASRARGCVSNQNSIDKCVGVWESQNVALPANKDLWLEVDTRGRITRVSADLEAAVADPTIPEKSRLRPGSTVLFDYTKDYNVFMCIQRWNTVGDTLRTAPEAHFRWVSGKHAREELNGRRRGTICLFHNRVGPRDMPDKRHR